MATKKSPKSASGEPKKTRTITLAETAWIRAGVHAKMTGKSISAMVEEWFLSMPEYGVIKPGKPTKSSD